MGAQKSKLGKKDLQELAKKTSCKYFLIVRPGLMKNYTYGVRKVAGFSLLHEIVDKISRLWYTESPAYRYRTIDNKFVD